MRSEKSIQSIRVYDPSFGLYKQISPRSLIMLTVTLVSLLITLTAVSQYTLKSDLVENDVLAPPRSLMTTFTLNTNLTFVHTPKCGGTYVRSILNQIPSINVKKDHHTADSQDRLTFTVMRDPVERFESLINYRLQEPRPRSDWPTQVRNAFQNITLSSDEVVRLMSDDDILGFSPYRSLKYYAKGVDILLSIQQLPAFLAAFGFYYDETQYPKKNTSPRLRGKFSKATVERIQELFADDVILWRRLEASTKVKTSFRSAVR